MSVLIDLGASDYVFFVDECVRAAHKHEDVTGVKIWRQWRRNAAHDGRMLRPSKERQDIDIIHSSVTKPWV